MGLGIQLKKSLDGAKIIHLSLKVIKEKKINRMEVKHAQSQQTSAVHFLLDFEAVVCEEVQKSIDCIMLIKRDINHYRVESRALRKRLKLQPPAGEYNRIRDKIRANKQYIVECEERILFMNKRALVLQEQLQSMSLAVGYRST